MFVGELESGHACRNMGRKLRDMSRLYIMFYSIAVVGL